MERHPPSLRVQPALSRRELLAALGVASLAACAAPSANDDAQSSAPPRKTPRHLFVIVADDLSRIDLGCYGNRDVHTPHIDSIAAQGVRFERAYTPVGVCKPSRSALYTGLMPHKNGALGFQPIRDGAPTWPELLRPELCATGMLGKLNTAPVPRFAFEHWMRPKELADTRDPQVVRAAFGATLERFDGRRMAVVVNLKDPHRPFRGPFADPDAPNQPVPHDPAKLTLPPHLFDTRETREELAQYYDAIWRLDRTVGALLAELDARGLAEDSLVVFTSDNGQGFPFAKTTLYEAGINLPFLVRWPAALKAGGVRREFVSLIDLLPTALEMFGVEYAGPLDGRSLLPLFAEVAPAWRTSIVGMHTLHRVGPETPSRSLRDERWKFILNLPVDGEFHSNVMSFSLAWKSWIAVARENPELRARMERFVRRPPEELYDLEADPFELVNLAENAQFQAQREAMKSQLLEWMRREGDPYLPA